MGNNDDVVTFKQHMINGNGPSDAEDVHHEFVGGMHGRKIDFDAIDGDSPLFDEWLAMIVATIKKLYSPERLKDVVLVSVANGTNRVVPTVTEMLGNGATYLLTEKASPKSGKLTAEALAKMPALTNHFFIVIEDVATKGTTSASVVQDLRANGGHDIEVINSWQRREPLEELDAVDVPYHAIIKEILPTFTPEECATSGLCAAGSRLIEHA